MPAKHPSSSSNSTAISASSAATDLEKQEATGQAAEVESRDGGSIDQGVQRPVKKLLKWWQAAFCKPTGVMNLFVQDADRA